MRDKQSSLLIIVLLLAFSPALQSYAQPRHNRMYTLKIKTDRGNFNGVLTTIGSGSVEITNRRNATKLLFYSTEINTIVVKKPFFRYTAKGVLLGAGAGAFLVLAYYAKQYLKYGRADSSDPGFGYTLWSVTVFGAGVGFSGNAIESLFARKKIVIGKLPYMYDNKRDKLNKYLFY
jgi:hypothetical protein